MNITLDQVKGVLQVLIPTLVAAFGSKFIPPDTITSFDNALVLIVVTLVSAFWSAQTTKTGTGK